MKKLSLIIAALATSFTFAQTPCTGGSAAGYPCDNVDFLARISLSTLGATQASDSWGWVDPDNGDEYALIGLTNGTAFIDITDPINPVYLGKLPTHTNSSFWRDIKVYQDHAFIVSEAGGHGMQVFDLTRLRNVNNPPVTFTEDAHYDQFGSAHNIVINEDTGYAYAVGTSTFSGGPHFINIQNPTSPTAAGGYNLDGYTHDAQVITYNGPDSDYTNSEILLGSNEDNIIIVDVTDKGSPTPIASVSYTNVGYTHQGWFTDNQRYFIVGDETDEIISGINTRTIIFDMEDLDNPQFLFDYSGPTPSSDHNGYVVGNLYYFASYTAGIRILDISDIANQNIFEAGFFDTIPGSDVATTNTGTWNVYPFMPSGNIIISDQAEGFILVDDTITLGTNDFSSQDFSVYPNPANTQITISSKETPISEVAIFNVLGQKVLDFNFDETNSEKLNISSLKSGVYIVQINRTTAKRLVVK